jgi:asparagine synthase (glutamine-hydrolysing)
MAQALKHEDWYQSCLYADEFVALGRVSLGILNPESQPIWNEDRTLCIVMEGEVYDYDHEKRRLVERGHRFEVGNDPEYVLHLYEEYGEDFALKLNGAFVAAIWDTRQRCLRLVNDRLGQQNLFYAQSDKNLLFASSVGAVLASGVVDCNVDLVAMAEFLTFEHMLEDRTLARSVKLMPPASMLCFQDGRLIQSRYWKLSFGDDYGVHEEDWYVGRWIELFYQATERRVRPADLFGVMLSGGMDSRAVLGAMARLSDDPFSAFTFGVPGCDDVRCAQEMARRLKVRHRYIELEPDCLRTLAEKGVWLTDGMNNCIHMHNLAAAQEARRSSRIVFTGNLGDDLMADRPRRGYSHRVMPGIDSWDDLVAMLLSMDTSCFSLQEQRSLFTDDCYRQIDGVVEENHRAVLSRADARRPGHVLKHWEITQRVRRFVLQGQVLLRNQVEVRGPFYDNDLVEFMANVPTGLRLDGYLYIRALSIAFPELAKVPLASTGFPLVPCLRYTGVQLARQLRWRARQAGFRFISAPRGQRPYADYDGWMRTPLRAWIEDTLLSKRAMERGYFEPDYVRGLIKEQISGGNRAGKLGGLLTLELWHRQFVD